MAKIYAAASYGIEAAGTPVAKIATFIAVVIDIFRSRNNNHDIDWFFAGCSEGKDLDPANQVLIRRCLEFRRAVCKRPQPKENIRSCLRCMLKQMEDNRNG